ncbi:MAG: DUF3082 domain-containing protein [Oscillatoriales cyanobacterium C42_A2020_001]|nr:DUF3082 domain-containing protein [Leptolyngbyaceae cyanobacterium C42_A2020_001]
MSEGPPITELPTPSPNSSDSGNPPLTPLRCLIGSGLAGVLAYAMYLMTHAIAQSFAVHKIHSTSLIVQRISSAVRTLVVGMTTLGIGVFGLAAIGLLALAIQLIIQRAKHPASSSDQKAADE